MLFQFSILSNEPDSVAHSNGSSRVRKTKHHGIIKTYSVQPTVGRGLLFPDVKPRTQKKISMNMNCDK